MQNELQFAARRGARRQGSGREKRISGMAHRERGRLTRHDPVLVTMKLAAGLPNLRREAEATVVVEAKRKAQRSVFRIVHFSIQGDHMHFLIEVDGRDDLVRGMRGLGCRLARG
jgi:hypothetical protein